MWPLGSGRRGSSEKSQDFFKSPAALYVRVMWTGMCCVCLFIILHADTYWTILVRKTEPFFISFWELYLYCFADPPSLFSLFFLFGTLLVEILNAGLILWFSFSVLWLFVLLFQVRSFLHTLCQSFLCNTLLLFCCFLDKKSLCLWGCCILCLFVLFWVALSLLLSAFLVYFGLLCSRLSWRSLSFFIY